MGKIVPASPRLLGKLAALAVAGLPAGAGLASALPEGSVEPELAALAGIACIVPFLVYGFRFLNNAAVRRSTKGG